MLSLENNCGTIALANFSKLQSVNRCHLTVVVVVSLSVLCSL